MPAFVVAGVPNAGLLAPKPPAGLPKVLPVFAEAPKRPPVLFVVLLLLLAPKVLFPPPKPRRRGQKGWRYGPAVARCHRGNPGAEERQGRCAYLMNWLQNQCHRQTPTTADCCLCRSRRSRRRTTSCRRGRLRDGRLSQVARRSSLPVTTGSWEKSWRGNQKKLRARNARGKPGNERVAKGNRTRRAGRRDACVRAGLAEIAPLSLLAFSTQDGQVATRIECGREKNSGGRFAWEVFRTRARRAARGWVRSSAPWPIIRHAALRGSKQIFLTAKYKVPRSLPFVSVLY